MIGTPVIGAIVANAVLRDLEENVTVVFQLQNTVSSNHRRVQSLYFQCNTTVFSCRLWRQHVFHGMKVLLVRGNYLVHLGKIMMIMYHFCCATSSLQQ